MVVGTNQSVPVVVVIGALIDGLRPTNRQLNQKCKQALFAFGKEILPLIIAKAQSESTPHPQRERLQTLVADLVRAGDLDVSNKLRIRVRDALCAALCVFDPILNERAIRALSHLGEPLVDHLIAEAVCHQQNQGYCLRLLLAVERMGVRLTVDQHLELWIMLGTIDSDEIRAQAMGLITAWRRSQALC